MSKYKPILLNYLPPEMVLKPNKKGDHYHGYYCYFCDSDSYDWAISNNYKPNKIVSYSLKKKVLKCFHCNISFKQYTKLKELVAYYKWLEDKNLFNYRVFKEEWEFWNQLKDEDMLPF